VRVLPTAGENAASYCRNHSFAIHKQASFDTADPHPSAVEYFLGALASDLIIGFQALAARHRVELEDLEAIFTGILRNPLVFLGVVGETGETGFETITGTIYVHTEGDEAYLRELWQETLRRSPLYNTIKSCVALDIQMQQTL